MDDQIEHGIHELVTIMTGCVPSYVYGTWNLIFFEVL